MGKIVSILLVSGSLLFTGGRAAADESPFRVWVPAAYSQAVAFNILSPFLELLGQRLDRPIRLQLYRDLPDLIQRCRRGEIDHAMLDKMHARELVEKCNFEIVAKASQPLFVFTTRISGRYRLSEVRSLGLFEAGSATRMVQKELDPNGNRYRLVRFNSLVEALSALFQGDIDGLVSLQGPIARLDKRINSKLRTLYRFKNRQTAYFIISPTLDRATRLQLSQLYLGNTPAMKTIFEDQLGLGEFARPSKDETSLFATTKRTHRKSDD